MNIWILNHHALTPDMGGGTRHYDMAKELVKSGHNVVIVASSFHYSKLKEMREYGESKYLVEDIDGVEFVWLKTPPYTSNGIKRVINMLSYTQKALFLLPKLKLPKPDLIIGSSVHLFAVYAAFKLAKRYKTPFVMEIRDLWPQTLIDMGMSKYHPFIVILAFLERYLYKRADKIITLLPKAHVYIESLGVLDKKIVWIPNGATIKELEHSKQTVLAPNKFNVVYAGAMGVANDLDLLIDTAHYLKDRENIHFTLIGDGVERHRLAKRCEGLQSVLFVDTLPKDELLSYLFDADLLYVGLRDLPLYRYGISMNKIYEYLSCAKPILFVSDIDENIIELASAGTVVKGRDVDKIANSIEDYSHMSRAELKEIGKNGYNYLLKNHTISILTDRLKSIIKELKVGNV